jgi:hypothetical protein
MVEAFENDNEPMFNDDEHMDELFVDDDEHPLPSYEEVMSMKEEYMQSLKKSCDELADKLQQIEIKYKEQFEKLTSLASCENITEIIELCEDYAKTLDCD